VTTTWMSKSSTILWAQVHKIFWSTIPWAKAWSWRADVHFIGLWKTASKTTFHIEMPLHNLKTLGKLTTQNVPFAMWRLSKSWLHEIKVVWLWRCPSQFEEKLTAVALFQVGRQLYYFSKSWIFYKLPSSNKMKTKYYDLISGGKSARPASNLINYSTT
jgi:hypothetical protein